MGSNPDRPELTITWTVTDTYQRAFAASTVAAASGWTAEELLVDPSLLHGGVTLDTADLLYAYQNAATERTGTEVEIIDTQSPGQLRLAELVDRAQQALRAETGTLSSTGQALAALLAGLRREQLIDQ